MVKGFMTQKNGKHYGVISYKDRAGNWKKKWINTGYSVKGHNLKKAETFFEREKMEFLARLDTEHKLSVEDTLFADYLEYEWLPFKKPRIATTTYIGYESAVKSIIAPFFRKEGIRLQDVSNEDIVRFYEHRRAKDGVKETTIKHNHAVISDALKRAKKSGRISSNPAADITFEKVPGQEHHAEYYSIKESMLFLCTIKGDELELLYKTDIYTGMRRSEILALKFSDIDWDNHTLHVARRSIEIKENKKRKVVIENATKTQFSRRTYILPDELIGDLRKRQTLIQEHMELCRGAYNHDNDGYIFVDALGNLISPSYASGHMQVILRNHNLKRITFHELRHTCATILAATGMNIKDIQEWLGHKEITTTANMYIHYSTANKRRVADMMEKVLEFQKNQENDQMIPANVNDAEKTMESGQEIE